MYSKQEQYAKETIKRLNAFSNSDKAEYLLCGRSAKNDLKKIVQLSRQLCGQNDKKFAYILYLISQYCDCDPEDSKEYRKEEDLLKAIIIAADKYAKSTQNIKANTDSKRNVAARIKMYFDGLMYGSLPAGPCPDSTASLSLGYTASETPLFSHEPISQDIPNDKTGPFFDGLRALAETDPSFITGMFRDCDNGKVYVRIYNVNEGFRPKYIEVEKVEAHFKWNIDQGGRCNWPGYIITALQNNNIFTDSDTKEIFGTILGSKVNEIDIVDFCSFSNE